MSLDPLDSRYIYLQIDISTHLLERIRRSKQGPDSITRAGPPESHYLCWALSQLIRPSLSPHVNSSSALLSTNQFSFNEWMLSTRPHFLPLTLFLHHSVILPYGEVIRLMLKWVSRNKGRLMRSCWRLDCELMLSTLLSEHSS